METKITVISDNIQNETLSGEWGLCLLIEYRGNKILVDAGASDLFLHNMKELGFDVKDVNYATLSHAHYDHANGMPAFFENNADAKFYVRETTEADCYSKKWIFHKYIGIPKKMMEQYADRIEIVSGDYRLMDGAYLIPHKTEGLSAIGRRESMYRKTANGWIVDDFSHEQSLVLETDQGLLIINSCSHGGVVNIINEIRKTFPDQKIYGYIGGFHLFNKTDQEIDLVADNLQETGLGYICTGHCTKEHAYDLLQQKLGNRLHQLHVGLVIEI
ncbi:MAG: MBL fold metallo-hydrolase [Erysipelotrichaceae bacterium]|nr:MBL fold metallo-hydrolase [Erysipelotrichaceae bacterium]